MKELRLLLFCVPLFLVSSLGSAQTFDHTYTLVGSVDYVATYQLSYQPDSTYRDGISTATMLLFLGKEASMFVERNKYVSDTMLKSVHNPAQFQLFLNGVGSGKTPIPKFFYYIYKGYPQDSLLFKEEGSISNKHLYYEKMGNFQWVLGHQQDSIKGFVVHNASCTYGGRHWTAWYCPDIPFSDGPWKFNGLPGLILRINDDKGHYAFLLDQFFKPSLPIDMEYKEGNYMVISREEHLQIRAKYIQNLQYRMANASYDRETQRRALQKAQLKNNPMELR